MTGEMATLDGNGDTRIMWDKDNAAEVKAARELFETLVHGKEKYAAYRAVGKDGNRGDLLRKFDPEAERIILFKQLQGG